MKHHIKNISWPTFVLTIATTLVSGILSYTNAISEIKKQIAITQTEQGNYKEMLLEVREDQKDQNRKIDEIRSLLIKKNQLDDIKMLLLSNNIRRK